MSKFQIVLLTVFGFFIIVAVLTFALYRGNSASEVVVTVWGDISASDFNNFLNSAQLAQDRTLSIRYEEVPAESLEQEFTEALAQGRGPDLIILPQDKFLKNRNKLVAIPYQSINEGDFRETFVEAGEVFLAQDGVYALPISIDPMVLYYNRDLLSAAGLAKPLSFWDEIYNQTLNLSKRDAAGNLTQSAVALGETRNISHFKDILSLLFIQAGTPVTGFVGDSLRSVLNYSFDLPVMPAESALEFYTQFANPTKAYYSWNRTLPEAQTRFTSGDLAYYLGYASELREIRSKSPTLNFSVALVPQSRVSGKTVTFGKVKGVAISRGSRDVNAALSAASKLVSADSAAILAQALALPPARRDLLSVLPTDSIFPVFYNASLQSRIWFDPHDEATQEIFRDMVDNVTSGRARISETVSKASSELDNLISK